MRLPLINTHLKNTYNDLPDCVQTTTTTTSTPRRITLKYKIIGDWLGIFIILVAVLIFYAFLKPPVQRFSLTDPALSLPLVDPRVNNILAGILSFTIPATTLLIVNLLFFGNKWDLYSGITGMVFAYVLSLLISSTCWFLIGGIRPNFLSTCDVDESKLQQIDHLKPVQYYTVDVCKNQKDFGVDTFHAFPSGHASSAFAPFTFLSCYLASHFRLYTHKLFLLTFLVYLPFLPAMWIATSRLADYNHSGLQVFVGIVIGLISGLVGYSYVYVNGLFFGYGRWAHIPSIFKFM